VVVGAVSRPMDLAVPAAWEASLGTLAVRVAQGSVRRGCYQMSVPPAMPTGVCLRGPANIRGTS
jgi:hypothetical protein